MKTNLKILVLSTIVALSFSVPQLHLSQAQENPFKSCPKEITFEILKYAAIDNYLSDGNTGGLMFVCQDWQRIMEENKMEESIKNELSEHVYQRFLNGVLIYRPDGQTDNGRINLPIRELVNPLEGTFDLSQCGYAGQDLSISTGYRKGKKAENANKVEIWFTPRFLVERELGSTAAHFKRIMDTWKQEQAPVGMFWTWGEWDELGWYDYLTTENMDNLSKIDLCENWKKSRVGGRHARMGSGGGGGQVYVPFSCSFYEERQG